MRDRLRKTCLITGATSGIGAAAALELARLGFDVGLVGRSVRRCRRQAERIERQVSGASVQCFVADLSSKREVLRLAAEVKERYRTLDVLVNNAGAFFTRREVSPDGLEMSFALNHLGGFILTNALLNMLRQSPAGRVVVVASHAHVLGAIDFEDLQSARDYNGMKAYAQSKLANVMFTYALARRLKGTRVTVNAVDPGNVATNLGSNNNWLRARVRNLVKRSLLRPEEGAQTVVYLASSPEVEGMSAGYYYECQSRRSSERSYDEVVGERLWKTSEELALDAASGASMIGER